MRTYAEHIAVANKKCNSSLLETSTVIPTCRPDTGPELLATGGGAFNTFLVERLKEQLKELNIEVIVPDKKLVNYKEALIMALIGVLRWREEYNVFLLLLVLQEEVLAERCGWDRKLENFKIIMINDPYIEVIQKTRSLNLEESLVEHSINKFLESGGDKTFKYLVHDNKIEEGNAWKLVEAIKKEFKSTYYVNALYAGIFMFLCGFVSLSFIGPTE